MQQQQQQRQQAQAAGGAPFSSRAAASMSVPPLHFAGALNSSAALLAAPPPGNAAGSDSTPQDADSALTLLWELHRMEKGCMENQVSRPSTKRASKQHAWSEKGQQAERREHHRSWEQG